MIGSMCLFLYQQKVLFHSTLMDTHFCNSIPAFRGFACHIVDTNDRYVLQTHSKNSACTFFQFETAWLGHKRCYCADGFNNLRQDHSCGGIERNSYIILVVFANFKICKVALLQTPLVRSNNINQTNPMQDSTILENYKYFNLSKIDFSKKLVFAAPFEMHFFLNY